MNLGRAWQMISEAGIRPTHSATTRRCIRLTNEMSVMVAVITALRAALDPLTIAHPGLRTASLAMAVEFAVVPLVMATGMITLAQVLFGFIALIGISWSTWVVGIVGQGHLLLVTIPMAAWLITPPTRIWMALGLSAVSVAAFAVFEWAQPPGTLTLSAEELRVAASTSRVLVVLVVVGFAFYAFRNTLRAESALALALRRSDDLLLNILPQAIADKLKGHRGAIADRFEHATILFADIVNFTVLAERTSPVDLVRMLDEVFTRFDALAEKHGLEKIKTIGDAYMVAAGIPAPRPDHVASVARMALDMRAVLTTLPAEFAQLNVRIGIHTGPVVAGVIGRKKFAYDLWGDSVNTASRMESHGEPGRIHVSSEVHDALDGTFEFEARGAIQVKGKGQLNTWFLLGEKTAAS